MSEPTNKGWQLLKAVLFWDFSSPERGKKCLGCPGGCWYCGKYPDRGSKS